jgi:hypothetical protein
LLDEYGCIISSLAMPKSINTSLLSDWRRDNIFGFDVAVNDALVVDKLQHGQ